MQDSVVVHYNDHSYIIGEAVFARWWLKRITLYYLMPFIDITGPNLLTTFAFIKGPLQPEFAIAFYWLV